jgi:PAS domain S-box-containing protein
LFLADWRHRVLATVPVARRDVIEHLADGVIVTDARAQILDMNPAAEEMTGALLRAVRGRHLVDVVVERAVGSADVDADGFRRVVDRLLASGGKFSSRLENRAGQVFEIRLAAVCPEDAELSGLYVIIREITKQTRFESLMRQSQRLETVAGLAAGIAHEVNNPLAYVRSNLSHVHRMTEELEVVDGDKAERDELRLVIEEAIEGVDRIGRIIERVRRFSRIGSEELAPASVNEIVSDAVRVARLGRFGAVELEVSLAEDVPMIEASAEALTQAVTNLLVNAAQAVAEGGGSVVVSTCSVDDQIEIRIADDGPGVPPEVRERMFDPFFTTKKTGEGTGLGLAVAFGITREHGGVLLYDPPTQGGATFLIRLPKRGRPQAGPELNN